MVYQVPWSVVVPYSFMYVYSVCVCAHVSVDTHVWKWEFGVSCLSHSLSTIFFLRQGLSVKLGLADWLGHLASKPQKYYCLTLPNIGFSVHNDFYIGAENQT